MNTSNIVDVPLSYYPDVRQPGSQAAITLGEWLAGTRLDRWCDDVEPARIEYQRHGKTPRYSILKLRIPAVTPAGTFSYRRTDRLIQASGILHADVDGLNARRLQWVRESLRDDPVVLYAFTSPSLAGQKFGVRIPPVSDDTTYKTYFWGLHRHCRRVHGIELDTTCQDISRLCFMSVDPQCYVNPSPELFTETVDPPTHGPAAHTQPNPIWLRFPQPKRVPTPAIAAAAQDLFDRAVRRLETAAKGTRHRSRLSVGALIGGLIQGGVLGQTAAEAIIDIAKTHSAHPEQAERTMRDALRFGAAHPITPEHRLLNRTRRLTRADNRE